MGFKSLALGTCCSLSLAGAVQGDAECDYDCGVDKYHQGKVEEAYRIFLESARAGSARSQYMLCTFYQRGIAVEEDEYKAFEWCRKAADNEMLEAQFQLGLMYLKGEGVTEDDYKAMEWLWRASERGYPQAAQVLQFISSDDFGFGC